MSLLEILNQLAQQLGLPSAVALYTKTPAPDTYLVITPLVDTFEVFADNTPGVQTEEARIAVFTRGNYLPLRDRLTTALLEAGLTITARQYVGYEPDPRFHHYAIDVAGWATTRLSS